VIARLTEVVGGFRVKPTVRCALNTIALCSLIAPFASPPRAQSQTSSQPVRREVAVTFDDLPGGYRLAPVTIDNQEWVFAEVYAMAKERGDKATAERVAAAYVTYMEQVFDFFERRSVEIVGYEIKQVLLLHANPLNADHFDELVRMMKRRGYAFITVDRALEDPAYHMPDTYAGPRGLSWLHRWASTKGMKMREEPREPEFIARLIVR
jgi:hypothetical protein